MLSLDEVEDELTVSLRAGETRVYDPERLRTAREQGFCDLADDPALDLGVANDPFGTSARPASNCGLTSTSARQPGAASASAGGNASLTEMNETSQVTSCGANGSSVSERALTRSSR